MDLYYRVAVTSIRIPPLRERGGDLCLLIAHFADQFRGKHGLAPCPLAEAVLERLAGYAWPGNVRELRNVVESMLLVADGEEVGLDALPAEFADATGSMADHGPATAAAVVRSIADGEIESIRCAIVATGGNLTRAARELDIAKSTLYEKVRHYGLAAEIAQVRARDGASRLEPPPVSAVASVWVDEHVDRQPSEETMATAGSGASGAGRVF